MATKDSVVQAEDAIRAAFYMLTAILLRLPTHI